MLFGGEADLTPSLNLGVDMLKTTIMRQITEPMRLSFLRWFNGLAPGMRDRASVEVLQATIDPPKRGEPLYLRVLTMNSGRSAAQFWGRGASHVELVVSKDAPSSLADGYATEFGACDDAEGKIIHPRVGPGTALEWCLKQVSPALRADDLVDLQRGARKLWAFGIFIYDDISNVRHHTRFCRQYVPQSSRFLDPGGKDCDWSN